MKNLLLVKIRLSWYFVGFTVIYFILSYILPGYKFNAGSLTLFSVNSFLYGFYISPILGAQKARIDALHQIIRSESNAIFTMVLGLKKFPDQMKHELQTMISMYLKQKIKQKGINSGEEDYEKLITYCVEYKGKESDQVDKLLNALVANQQNRTNFNMQVGNKVFTNEWLIIGILFSITLGFILFVSIPSEFFLVLVKALLCTGLTMLLINLVKLNFLTHKRAKQMWDPLNKLIDSNYYRID